METNRNRESIKSINAINNDFIWLEEIIDLRLEAYYGGKGKEKSIYDNPPPNISDDMGFYGGFIRQYGLRPGERAILLMAMAPHLKPEIFDRFFSKNDEIDRVYTEFGGVKGQQHGGFLPTGETVAFILAENSLVRRVYLNELFSDDHIFKKLNILKLEKAPVYEPMLAGRLTISDEYLKYLTTGAEFKPSFNEKFPAQEIQSKLVWEDLILGDEAKEEVENMLTWIEHYNKDDKFQQRLMPGYRALFYGPPGTGKTLTSILLGKQSQKSVYRIDLSQMVSKYIGETEKNLSNLFEIAENRDWILFFDEADAIFGQRTEMKDSKDRFANQETAYLLQRLESYNGIIVLATNLKPNIDRAFMRRFQAIVYFGIPNRDQRLKLWKNIQKEVAFDEDVDLIELSANHELSGGAINNIVQNAWISSLKKNSKKINRADIQSSIRREYLKEGKTFLD